jgi:catechol 2,3-dioxygenase-like lactoylglutathione lyase family enzyme
MPGEAAAMRAAAGVADRSPPAGRAERDAGVSALLKSASVEAITMFTEDLGRSKLFYQDVFGLPLVFEDEASAVFKLQNTVINLLKIPAARELIDPGIVANREAGARFQLTIGVDDVDAVCAELGRRGVALLNGPMDRPWGIRTACFTDPGGHI